MKKIITLFTLILMTTAMMAEQVVGSYHSSYFDKDYEVEAAYSKGEQLSVYITVEGNSSTEKVYLNFKGEDIEALITSLQLSKTKFIEWEKIARENNVTDMMKPFDISFPYCTVAWYGSQWWFCFRKSIAPDFMVTSDGQILFLITGTATSSRNEYIDTKYYLALSSEKDFDSLIDAINPMRIKEQFEKKERVNDLFK